VIAKLLFFGLLCLVVYLLVKGGTRKSDPRRAADSPPVSMVACARCGLYLPLEESLERGGRRYCCREHLRLDAGDRP